MNRMLDRVRHGLRGDGLRARALRSSGLTLMGYAGSQVLRLASNLILTRLLFPEAFGVMVLVSIFMMGLAMFSDVGVGPSILQSKRGDDPEFLNTAWTIQVIRGALLWVATCVLAVPAATFYDAPQLAQLLPVAGMTLLITGLNPTRLESANRHLMLGRVTAIDFVTQISGIVAAVLMAWWLQSVWALVLSGLLSALVQLYLYNVYLPGERNRFRWEKSAAEELIRFGKWIFLSTLAGFLLFQGDKVILGKFLTLEALGVFNIGYFLASFPLLLGGMVVRKTLIPIYRELPPKESPENFAKLRKMRYGLSALILILLAMFAMSGVVLVNFMYDARYALAGGIVVIVAAMQVPSVVVLTYDQAALAAGDSRQFFVLSAVRAVLTLAGLLLGVQYFGLMGALIGQGVAYVLAYPVVVWLARSQGTWDPLHDAVIFALGVAVAGFACWINMDAIIALSAMNSP